MTDITNTAGNDLKNYAYNILKERLINCTYAPGSILNEAHLTSEMKLSRTPVREAVSRLETEGFVKVIPKKGIHVTDILLSDVLQIFQIRTEFEPTILRLSASRLPKDELLYFIQRFENPDPDDTVMDRIRLDTAMHLFIIEHCGNRYMVDIMHRVYDISSRIIFFIHQNHAAVYDDSGENLEILRSEAREMYTVLEEVSKDIKKDSPDLSEQGMESMTERFLAFLDAMLWMLKGSKYLWEEKDNERNSK